MRATEPSHLVRLAAREAQHAGFSVTLDRTRSVDFLWPSHRLAVETDSYRHHQGDVSFEDDHARDLALRRCGFTVLRYTGRQLEREGAAIAAELRGPLAAPPA